MKLLQYRGRRIWKWDDRLFFRSVILCIVFSFATGITGVLFFNRQEMPEIEHSFMHQAAVVLLFTIMLSTVLIAAGRKNKTLYENLENRQALARMMIDNGWYETDLRSNNKGDQDLSYLPRLYYWRRRSITYFPKMYYRKKDRKIYITVKISMGKYQDQLLHLESKIETGLNCEIVAADYKQKWMHYTFLCDVEKNRIGIMDMQAEKGGIRFMTHIFWNYDKYPHALISGETGSGKTFFLLSIVEILLAGKAELFIVDAKNADLAGLETVLPHVYYKEEDISVCIIGFYEAMTERMTEMKKRADYTPGKNYSAYGLTPNFLIFDEYVAYMEMLSKKEWEETISVIKKIALLGRQAGYFLVLACQRPDAKYLPDGIRGQFGFRAALGSVDESGYTMMFGSTEKNFIPKAILGRGYVKLWNGIVTEFYAPLVPPEHDFIQSIKNRYHAGEYDGGEAV